MPDYGTPPPPSDTVTLGGGAWQDPREPRRGRTWWYVGGGAAVAIALVVGGTVFAASQLNDDRAPGAAAGLPSDTLAYAGIDLDPSMGQKIAAIQALRKFPAFTGDLKIDPSTDLRKLMLDDLLQGPACKDLSWDDDVKPWLGTDIAAAIVPTVSGGPQPVTVLKVTDESAATKSLPALLSCAHGPQGLSVAHGWAVVAKNTAIAQSVSNQSASNALADDGDFKTWTERTGDPGVATFYASPAAGKTLASSLDSLAMLGMSPFAFSSGSGASSSASGAAAPAAHVTSAAKTLEPPTDPFAALGAVCPHAMSGKGMGDQTPLSGGQMDLYKAQMRKLQGAAATLRFARSGFELETASGVEGATPSSGTSGLATLPKDTAVAFGFGGARDWITSVTDAFAQGFVQECGGTPEKLWQTVSTISGLSLPGDLHTLFDGGVTLSLSGSTDPEKLTNGGPGDLPAGIKLTGDPDAIASVLGKITLPGVQEILATTKGDGVLAVGPNADYRDQLLKNGGLGDSADFKDVVPQADKAPTALFVSFANLQPILTSAAAEVPRDVQENLAHLGAFGQSTWVGDDGIGHGLIRLSTK
ncbi:DUF3352 domain-containing protein [Nocardioides nematodiphilus]|uniref:DUF3352 domain-containing protein n=1 Tax=Nocardioides nematodiphilus TaxID=2849669 RepID=UPI001CD94718|nr:DUF3352 domain-containing protein [Nocardioides nematodiphilus]MCA1982506.1 DUF3352 domain-containing protein [Nocardioides nematodiphilus]